MSGSRGHPSSSGLSSPYPRSNRGDCRRYARRLGGRRGARHPRGAAAGDHRRRKFEPRRLRSDACRGREAPTGYAALRSQAVRGRRAHLLRLRSRPAAFTRAPDAERSAPWRPHYRLGGLRCRVRRSLPFQSRLPSALRRDAVGDQAISTAQQFASPLIEARVGAWRHLAASGRTSAPGTLLKALRYRSWVLKLGPAIAQRLRRRSGVSGCGCTAACWAKSIRHTAPELQNGGKRGQSDQWSPRGCA